MGLMAQASGGGSERELIPAGLQRAVCASVADLGTHMDKQWNKLKRLVRLTFELADVRGEFEVDGETKDLPRLMGKNYTLSLHEKASLRKDLQAWRNKPFTPEELAGFDISNLVGVPCMVNVEHYNGSDGKQRAGIGGVLGLMPGMEKPVPEGTTYYYGIDDHGREFPEGMPDFVKERILESVEMGGAQTPAPAQAPAPVAAPPQAPPPFPAAEPAPAPVPVYDEGGMEEDDVPF